MYLKRFLRTDNIVELSYRLTILLLSTISSIACFFGGNLVLLPVSFLAMFYFLVILPDSHTNILGKIIIGIAFIRYCYVPLTYNLPEHRGLHSWYVNTNIQNQLLIQTIMIMELFAIFLVEYLYFKKRPYTVESHNTSNSFTIIRPVSFICIFVSILIIIVFPRVIPFLNKGREPSNAVYSIFHACFLMSFLYAMEVINKKVNNPWKKLVLLLGCFFVFIFPSCIQHNSISRNLLIIYSLAFVFELAKSFPKQKKYIAIISSILIVVGFAALTSIKSFSGRVNGSPLTGTFLLFTDYSMCNAYFAGPTNYEIGINLFNSGVFGFKYFINDLFANVPFLANYFSDNNTVYLFNECIFRGIAQQEIAPLGIQSMIYFGPFLSWVIPALMTYLSIKTYDFANNGKLKRIGFRYPLFCFSIVFGMSQIISLNAISMLIIIMFVPALVLTFVEEVLLFFVQKVRFRNQNQPKTNIGDDEDMAVPNLETHNRIIIAKNYFFSLFHQVILFLIPLITTPYISQTLLSDGIGKYDFAYSIAYYFVMFANFGFGYYAQRAIATKQKNKEERSKIFFEIMICKGIFTIIPLIVYLGLILSKSFESYNSILWVLSISIIASFFDISFLFKGMEDFKTVSIIQTVVKIVTSSLFFVFVKGPNDLIAYAVILNSYSLFSCIFLFPFAKKLISTKSIGKLNIKQHLLPSFILFLPTIFGLFYTTFLRTMIGVLVSGTTIIERGGEMVVVNLSDIENGYFSQADKLVQMGLAIVTSLGAVMASRNSSLFSSGNTKTFKNNITNVTKLTLFLTIPICIGIISISDNLVPWFFGDGFENVGVLLKYYPLLIIISGLGNVFGLQCLVAKGNYTRFTIGTLIGAIVSISIGIPLILNFGAYGAAIASLIAETSVIIVFLIFMHGNLRIAEILYALIKYSIAGLGIFVIVNSLSNKLPSSIIVSALLMVVGVVVYISALYILKDRVIFASVQKIKRKVGSIIYE